MGLDAECGELAEALRESVANYHHFDGLAADGSAWRVVLRSIDSDLAALGTAALRRTHAGPLSGLEQTAVARRTRTAGGA